MLDDRGIIDGTFKRESRMSPFHSGEIYWADLPDAGSHEVIVISLAELNRGNRVQAVPVTSRHFERRSKLPTCVALIFSSVQWTDSSQPRATLWVQGATNHFFQPEGL